MSVGTEKPSAASDEDIGLPGLRGSARRRITRLVVGIVLALLIGGLGGLVLYLLLEAL